MSYLLVFRLRVSIFALTETSTGYGFDTQYCNQESALSLGIRRIVLVLLKLEGSTISFIYAVALDYQKVDYSGTYTNNPLRCVGSNLVGLYHILVKVCTSREFELVRGVLLNPTHRAFA